MTVVIDEFNRDMLSDASKFLLSFKQAVDITQRIIRRETLQNKTTSSSMLFHHQQSSSLITVAYLIDEFISTFVDQLTSSFKFESLVFNTWIFLFFIVHQIAMTIKSKQSRIYDKFRRSNDEFCYDFSYASSFIAMLMTILMIMLMTILRAIVDCSSLEHRLVSKSTLFRVSLCSSESYR